MKRAAPPPGAAHPLIAPARVLQGPNPRTFPRRKPRSRAHSMHPRPGDQTAKAPVEVISTHCCRVVTRRCDGTAQSAAGLASRATATEKTMPERQRDPYSPPLPPRERGGLMLRLAIVAVLLGAAGWAYMTYSQGPGLTQEARVERPGAVADASGTHRYTAPRATIPEAAPPPVAPSTAPPPAEPPPTTTTIPPA